MINNMFISVTVITDFSVLIHKCNCCIRSLSRWLIADRLHMNADKTDIMMFPKIKIKTFV